MAHSMNIMVVAEGIETEEQYQLLKSYGCDFGQGYYIAKPMGSTDAARFMGFEPTIESSVHLEPGKDVLDDTGKFPKLPSARRRRNK
jgi:predicted signal transduction protein with EAL and GGDEF domain